MSILKIAVLGVVSVPLLSLSCATGSAPATPTAERATAVQDDTNMKDPVIPQLTVRGEATLDKPADQIEIRMSVVTDSTDSRDAIDANTRKSRDVIDALHDVGLTDQEYQTGQYRVQPQYEPRPRTAEPDWRPRILGYRVTSTLLVKSRKIADAGKIIDAATQAGVNAIDSVQFSLAEPRLHRAEAIRTATSNALFDAETLAGAAGLKIVRVLSINLDDAQAQPVMQREMMASRAMASPDSPPIAPGDVTVRASVTIVLEVASH